MGVQRLDQQGQVVGPVAGPGQIGAEGVFGLRPRGGARHDMHRTGPDLAGICESFADRGAGLGLAPGQRGKAIFAGGLRRVFSPGIARPVSRNASTP